MDRKTSRSHVFYANDQRIKRTEMSAFISAP